jgi:hypothetical protein
MARQATTIRLRPARSEGWTELSLSCALPDSLPPAVLYQLLSLLAFWSGRRLDVVLDAGRSAGWCEVWADALAVVPERHLSLRFELGAEEDGPRDGR